MKRPMLLLALAVVSLTSAGCDEKKKAAPDAHGDAGAADKYVTADPKLTKALQAAASASAAQDNGPPPSGIFPAGGADQRHARGAPTKVDVVSEGASPGVLLSAQGDGGDALTSSYGPGVLDMGISLGRGVALLDFGLQFGPAKKEDGGADWLVAEVKRARPGKDQMGSLPAGAEKELAGLEGTLLRLKATPDGRVAEVQEQLSKQAIPELDQRAQAAVEALVFATVPLPPKPVGVGAQWIAETRMPLSGLDAIVYRAYRIKSIEGDRVHLTVQGSAYAASKDVLLPGIPKGATLEQFQMQAEGELELVRGEFLARKSEVKQGVVLVFAGPGGPQPSQQPGGPPGNMMTAQLQSQATLLRGDDLRAAARP